MQVYGSILPGAATLARLLPEQAAEARHKASEARQEVKLSGPAQHRLKVVRWHLDHGENVSLTARHFGRSRTSVQAWLKAYKAHGPPGLEDKSHRPHKLRQPTWSSELERRVLALREQFPRWGKDKLVVLLRREGIVVSTSMIGRILKRLKDTGRLIEPLPQRRRRKRNFARPYAIRKPKGYLVREPGDLVEATRLTLDRSPASFSSTSPAGTSSRAGTSWASTVGPPLTRPASTSTSCWRARPSRSRQSRSTVAPSSRPSSKQPARSAASNSSSCRPVLPSSTVAWNGATGPTARSSTRSMTWNGLRAS